MTGLLLSKPICVPIQHSRFSNKFSQNGYNGFIIVWKLKNGIAHRIIHQVHCTAIKPVYMCCIFPNNHYETICVENKTSPAINQKWITRQFNRAIIIVPALSNYVTGSQLRWKLSNVIRTCSKCCRNVVLRRSILLSPVMDKNRT